MKRTILIILTALGYVLFHAAILFPAAWSAQASTAAPAPRKLVGASWHCWQTYPCELWYLTRPARQGERPEKITIVREDAAFDEASEAKPTRQRGDVSIPVDWKLFGAGWKCGAGGCELSVQLRKARKGEPAESYLFHNGSEYFSIRESP